MRRLTRALVASADHRGLSARVTRVDERPWWSATFAGVRLTVVLDIADGDAASWLAALPEEDFAVPGSLVADLVVRDATTTQATLEVLLLEA